MKKRAWNILLLCFLVLTFSSSFVAAAGILDPIDDLFIDIIPNPDLNLPNVRENVSIWIFATFTIVYSIFYAVTGKVSVLAEASGARTGFAIAFGVLAVVVPGIISIVASIGFIGMVILVIVALFMLIRTGWNEFSSGARKSAAEGYTISSDLEKAKNLYHKEELQGEKERNVLKNEDAAVHALSNIDSNMNFDVNKLEKSLGDMRQNVQALRHQQNIAPNSPEVQRLLQSIYARYASVVQQYKNLAHHDAELDQLINSLNSKTIIDNSIAINLRDEAASINRIFQYLQRRFGNKRLRRGAAGPPTPRLVDNPANRAKLDSFMRQIFGLQKTKMALVHDITNQKRELRTLLQTINADLTNLRNQLASSTPAGAEPIIDKVMKDLKKEQQILARVKSDCSKLDQDIKTEESKLKARDFFILFGLK